MTYRMLIDGALEDGAHRLEVINPATGRVFATAARADAEQLGRAVAGARRAFPLWAAFSPSERGERLEKLADAFQARFEQFAHLLTEEQGKPLPESRFEIGGAIAAIRAFAAMEMPDEVLRETDQERIVLQRSPLGVVAAITPWNFPMLLLMMKVAPALVAGNTVIAKPAPTTPLTTLLFGEVAQSILPAGVLSVIVDDNDLAPLLTQHPQVSKVSFTGSTNTGRKVMSAAAGTLKRLTLELGGNDAAIVLDDADIGVVAPQIFRAATLNAGQVCLAAKRVYAPASLYDALCDALAAIATGTIVDDGLKQGTQMGPIQNRRQLDRVGEFLEDARANGNVIAGGKPLDRDGFFIPPTIVRDISDDTRIVREEQFGPVLPVIRYTDVDDAVARANDSDYGLGGTIWTADPQRGLEIARGVDAGTVWVNKHLDLPFDVPFGGAKQSGIGTELGREGLESFTQAKVINASLA